MNILLVNTNQISIRLVEELLAKNNIPGEVAMVRAGRFALDLMQGMHIDLLVCEIDNETKEKARHFLSESRKMAPDAYYIVLMDGESLGTMQEGFLSTLDDFITIPFEERALRLRLNRGILACIEKKKKAGIAAGKPSVRMAESDPVPIPSVESGQQAGFPVEKTVDFPATEATPSPSSQTGVQTPEVDDDAGKPGTPERSLPGEDFPYEPSYEELLQHRNRILRKEKEAAWLHAMASQISSPSQEEVREKTIRSWEERKTELVLPSDAGTQRRIHKEPGTRTLSDPLTPEGDESIASQPMKPLHDELPADKDAESASDIPRAKSVVNSLFESLSKLKEKSLPWNPQMFLASEESGSDPGMENPLPSDDLIPEEGLWDLPVPDEEYVQEIPPRVPEKTVPDVTEAVLEETSSTPEEKASDASLSGVPDAGLPRPETPPVDDLSDNEQPSQEPPAGEESTAQNDDVYAKPAEGLADAEPSPRQVPHLQDEIRMDPTEPFIMEPDEPVDDTDAPFADLIEEADVFGIEEDVEIPLVAEEDALLDEVLVLPFEEDPRSVSGPLEDPAPDSRQDPLQGPHADAASGGEESRHKEDTLMAAEDTRIPPTPDDETVHPDQALSVGKKPEDLSGPERIPLETESPPSAAGSLEERIPESIPAEPVPEHHFPNASATEASPEPLKNESLDLRQYMKESEEEDTKGLRVRFRKTFGKKSPS